MVSESCANCPFQKTWVSFILVFLVPSAFSWFLYKRVGVVIVGVGVGVGVGSLKILWMLCVFRVILKMYTCKGKIKW